MSNNTYARAIICTHYDGEPEMSEPIWAGTRYKRRLLVGWNHQRDNARGIEKGKMWCWVGDGPKAEFFQVYDEPFNRSLTPGIVRFCGPANFTMIRMFHPYWCPGGHIPKDMDPRDKRELRDLYKDFICAWKGRENAVVEEELEELEGLDHEIGRRATSSQRGLSAIDLGQERYRDMYALSSLANSPAPSGSLTSSDLELYGMLQQFTNAGRGSRARTSTSSDEEKLKQEETSHIKRSSSVASSVELVWASGSATDPIDADTQTTIRPLIKYETPMKLETTIDLEALVTEGLVKRAQDQEVIEIIYID